MEAVDDFVSERDDDSDALAFEHLFSTNREDLTRFAARRVGAETASDVVAEVFLIAWRRRADYSPGEARLWLFGVAHKVIANELRTQGRKTRLAEKLQQTSSGESDDPSEAAATAMYVRSVLAMLPWHEQEALRLTQWESLSTAEAATVMGCSQAAFRVRQHRARRPLAALLTDPDQHPRGPDAPVNPSSTSSANREQRKDQS